VGGGQADREPELGIGVRKKVDELIQLSRKHDSEVDSLLYTTFWDKVKVLLSTDGPGVWVGSRRRQKTQLRKINDFLRNPVAHARDYAASREDVERLQVMVQPAVPPRPSGDMAARGNHVDQGVGHRDSSPILSIRSRPRPPRRALST